MSQLRVKGRKECFVEVVFRKIIRVSNWKLGREKKKLGFLKLPVCIKKETERGGGGGAEEKRVKKGEKVKSE